MAIKTVIFDYDGVLFDSKQIVLSIYREIGKQFNVREFNDAAKKNSLDFFEVDWRQTLRKVGIVGEEQQEAVRQLYRRELKKRISGVKPYPRIGVVIRRLSKTHRLGIVSNNSAETITRKLEEHGLKPYFGHIEGAGDVLKPDPTPINSCLKKLNSKPEEAVYVGDMDGDILAARNAAVKSIAVSYGYHSVEKLKKLNPDAIINRPEELIGLIEEMEKMDAKKKRLG